MVVLGGCKINLPNCVCVLGFGFVGFQSEEVVEQVCQTHFHQLNGKTVCTTIHLCAFFMWGSGWWCTTTLFLSLVIPINLCTMFCCSQVEVKKAEPRYATASASADAYRASMGPGMGGYNSQTNYGGMTYPNLDTCVAYIVLMLVYFPLSRYCQCRPISNWVRSLHCKAELLYHGLSVVPLTWPHLSGHPEFLFWCRLSLFRYCVALRVTRPTLCEQWGVGRLSHVLCLKVYIYTIEKLAVA